MHKALLKNQALKLAQEGAQSQAPAPEGGQLTQEQIEEAKLKAKYGGALPKKKAFQKEQQYFDSADWALSKSGDGDVVDPKAPVGQAHVAPATEKPPVS